MDKVSELVRFFSTIAILIRSAVKNAVTPYRKTLAVATKQLAIGTNYLSISMCNVSLRVACLVQGFLTKKRIGS